MVQTITGTIEYQDFIMVRGSDFDAAFSMVPYQDISTFGLRFAVYDPDDPDTTLFERTTAAGHITFEDGDDGAGQVAVVRIARANTEDLAADIEYDFDLWRTDTGSEGPLAAGRMTLLRLPRI